MAVTTATAAPSSAPQPEKKPIDGKSLTMCYQGPRSYFKDFESGRCFTNRDMLNEIDPKTLEPLK